MLHLGISIGSEEVVSVFENSFMVCLLMMLNSYPCFASVTPGFESHPLYGDWLSRLTLPVSESYC